MNITPEESFSMRTLQWTLIAAACTLALAGCKKKSTEAETAAASTPPAATTPASAPAPEPAELSDEQRQAAEKQAKLAYSTMEDGYLNDAKAQWAATARASSSFGDQAEEVKADPKASRAWKATGAIDGYTWSQTQQDVGMDWLELGYARPANATEVRAVFASTEAVEAVTKLELIDEAGTAQTVWSGISEVKRDKRGDRTWFVRSFPKTATRIKAVKLTFANNVSSGYKEVDAVQLVGE
jgi:hypothetical protein